MLDRLGAAAAAAVCRRRLRRAGVPVPRGPRAATRSNPGRLTDRQLEVLALLAEGRTNAEIAARLVVSPRTVDNHVAALLRRLGVRSRREVAGGRGRPRPAPAGWPKREQVRGPNVGSCRGRRASPAPVTMRPADRRPPAARGRGT